MLKLRRLMLPALIALLLVASASSAFAEGRVTVTHKTVGGTVDWTIPPGQCKAVKLELKGSGERHQEIITKVYANGSSTILINDLVKGTASDSTGTYHFVYINHSTETVPADGGAHQIEMVDSFVLNGHGSAKLNVGFNWRWTFTPPALYWPPVDNWQKISDRGDPLNCDPI
jgi:hypothetical protein